MKRCCWLFILSLSVLAEEPVPPKLPLHTDCFQQVYDEVSSDSDVAQNITLDILERVFGQLKDCSEEYLERNLDSKSVNEMFSNAESNRGHVIRVHGKLRFIEKLDVIPNKLGTAAIFRGFVETEEGHLVGLLSLEEPPSDIKHATVTCVGLFVQRHAFLNRMEGDKLTWTPLIFVNRIYKAKEESLTIGAAIDDLLPRESKLPKSIVCEAPLVVAIRGKADNVVVLINLKSFELTKTGDGDLLTKAIEEACANWRKENPNKKGEISQQVQLRVPEDVKMWAVAKIVKTLQANGYTNLQYIMIRTKSP